MITEETIAELRRLHAEWAEPGHTALHQQTTFYTAGRALLDNLHPLLDALAAAEAEIRRQAHYLERIAMHGCQCSPERRIDDEERPCASCLAHMGLGLGDPLGQADDGTTP